jgi:hypothetical protein
MASYLVLGAGRFGRLALERLARQDAGAVLWVVDRDPAALAAARAGNHRQVQFRAQEAIDFLRRHLDQAPWDWLIPMVPVHVAFAYLAADPRVTLNWERVAVPAAVGHGVPVVRRGPQGEFYLSRASHRCPDDCQPGSVCPVSGEARDPPLYEHLASLQVPGFEMVVVASRQLAPGVGGYPPRQLAALAGKLAGCREKALIATACRCHGVVHGLARRG